MDRIFDTNIWYKTYMLKNNVKFKYNFSINYEFDNDYKKIKAKSILDPLNPNKIVFAKDEEDSENAEMINSLVILPKAKKGGKYPYLFYNNLAARSVYMKVGMEEVCQWRVTLTGNAR